MKIFRWKVYFTKIEGYARVGRINKGHWIVVTHTGQEMKLENLDLEAVAKVIKSEIIQQKVLRLKITVSKAKEMIGVMQIEEI